MMEIYSTCLWHLAKENQLSALAQDMISVDKNCPETWCTAGNCLSLNKEHDQAIKLFQRAVQVGFSYIYTLLYIFNSIQFLIVFVLVKLTVFETSDLLLE